MKMHFNAACLASWVLAALFGCGTNSSTTKLTAGKATASATLDDHAHAHADHGPHEGQLVELGQEDFHAELVHDDATHTVTVYVLDSAAKGAVPIEEPEIALNVVAGGKPTQYKLAASPQDGETAGLTSRFVLVDEKLIEQLEANDFSGRLNLTIKGKSYSGAIKHHDHDQH